MNVGQIHESQHQRVNPFLLQIKDEGLDKIIINVGPVDVKNAPSLYKQCDALIMPSLIETYCLPYVESMHHKRLILTSDMDFSREVCGDAAVYFDPLNHHSILEAIEEIYSNDTLREEKIRNGVTKAFARKAYNGILPESTRTRIEKKGWNAPAHKWFAHQGRQKLLDLISSRRFNERGIYNQTEVRNIIDQHCGIIDSGKNIENHMMVIWQIVSLEMWLQKFDL